MNRQETQNVLQASDIRKSFTSGPEVIEVLKGVDLGVRAGEMVGIVGASGSGKTTLLQILGTLDTPDSGRIIFRGKELPTGSESSLCEHRNRHIGFIFQFHHLLPEFTALENVMMPGLIGGDQRERLQRRAVDLMRKVGLHERLHHRPGRLSGGEQQRVALARALVMNPALLLADEPTGNLDVDSGRRVFELLRELSRSLSLAVIMVTHNLELTRDMDRVLKLTDGILVPAIG